MRDTINIKGLGAIQLEAPRSFVAINDLVSEYSANQKSRAKLARLSAAAVGLCWSEKNVKSAPVYDLGACEIIAYGGDVLEWMLRNKCDLPSLYENAMPLFLELWALIPKEQEVAVQAETFPEKGRTGSAGAEDSAALGA
tara:strand:- start:4 stop:423 length:420 start_codon:yes stop_codon:yes gene_type:complete